MLVEKAGGKMTDWHGNPWKREDSFLLASNGVLHQEFIKQIAVLQP